MPPAQGIRAGKAYVELGVDDKIARGLRRASMRLRAFGATVSRIGAGLAKFGAILAVPLGVGAKVFASFEQQLAMVSTMLDEPQKHMQRFKDAIRAMAVEFGESTEALAGGLYDILSASIAPEKALEVLTAAVQAAKAGLTDTKTAADAITTVLNSYGLAADRAADVSDWLFAVVKRGKTTFAELAPAIGMVASTAANANVGLEELGAVLATLTRVGIKTENAVTAVNRTIATFMKPTDDAARYARSLGFELSTSTLKAEGLLGVFQRIGALPPEAIARLFPNIRALRGVIPAIRNLGAVSKDVQLMADRAGRTEEAYKRMTNTLTHSFNQLKQSVVVAFSKIGEALLEPLTAAIKKIKQWAGAVGDFMGRNKDLIIAIAKLAGLTLAAGVGLLVLGKLIAAAGAGLAALAFAAKLAFGALALVKVALLALLTPLGAIIAGVAALGAYILYATGAAGKALGWLGGKFGELKGEAEAAWGGIADALAAGDIGLAAKILWLTLQLQWTKGVTALKRTWTSWKESFLKAGLTAFDWMLRKTNWVVTQIQQIWIRFSAGMRTIWQDVSWFFAINWEDMKTTAAQAANYMRGVFDKSYDAAKANAEAQAKLTKKLTELDAKRGAAKAKITKESEAEWQKTETLWEETEKVLDRTLAAAKATAAAEGKAARTAAEAALQKAKDDLEHALYQAALSRAATARERAFLERQRAEGPPEPGAPPGGLDVNKIVEGLKAGLSAAARITVQGAFGAAGLELMGGARPAERTAKATEKTAKDVAVLVREVRERLPLRFA